MVWVVHLVVWDPSVLCGLAPLYRQVCINFGISLKNYFKSQQDSRPLVGPPLIHYFCAASFLRLPNGPSASLLFAVVLHHCGEWWMAAYSISDMRVSAADILIPELIKVLCLIRPHSMASVSIRPIRVVLLASIAARMTEAEEFSPGYSVATDCN